MHAVTLGPSGKVYVRTPGRKTLSPMVQALAKRFVISLVTSNYDFLKGATYYSILLAGTGGAVL